MHLQCLTPACYMSVATCKHKHDDHCLICSKLLCTMGVCFHGLCDPTMHACSYTVVIFPGLLHHFAVVYTEKLSSMSIGGVLVWLHYVLFSGLFFFFCLVCTVACYTLSNITSWNFWEHFRTKFL